jgi:prolactin regulatory element-binding protein
MAFTTLDTTNFPLYAVDVLDQSHFLVAGGGGAAKTGVPNCMVSSAVMLSKAGFIPLKN